MNNASLKEITDETENFDSIFWNETSPEKFLTLLRSHEQEVREILDTPDEEAITIVGKFKNLLHEIVKNGNFKKKLKKKSNDAPWFDGEYEEFELRIYRIKFLSEFAN